MIKEIVKGVWKFGSYLFVPQWGRNRNNHNNVIKNSDKRAMRSVGYEQLQ